MLLYVTPIWSEATKYKWCTMKLRAVQRKMLVSTVHSFRSISIKSTRVLTNSRAIEKRAQQLSALVPLKKSCSGNELIRDLLSQANMKAAGIQNIEIDWSKIKNSIHQVLRR